MPEEAAFPRSARLLVPSDYARVFSRPCRSGDALFTVLGRCNQDGRARLGLAIARKAVPTAVARNRLKRLIRESFRRHQQDLDSLDLVVMARSGALTRRNNELVASLDQHWTRIVRRCVRSSSA